MEQQMAATRRHYEEVEKNYPGFIKAIKDNDTGQVGKVLTRTTHVRL